MSIPEVSNCRSLPREYAYNIRQLCLCNQILRFCSNKLLLQSNQLCAFWLLCLELGNLVCDLCLVVSAGLDTLLRIPDRLQDCSAIVQVVCIEVLLFAKFGQQDANLVGDIADSIVGCSFAPVRELACDGEALFASSFVALDEVVLRLDELVELFTQLWLNSAAEGAEAEAMTSARGAGVLVGADREGSIPAK